MTSPDGGVPADWLDPEIMRERLARCGLFLMAYELLRAAIVDGVRDFYVCGLDEDGAEGSDAYRRRVVARDKHLFAASMFWLQEHEVIDADDFAAIQEIRAYRNKIAHAIPGLVTGQAEVIPNDTLRTIDHYVRKIDNYWGRLDAELMLEPEQLSTVDMESIVSSRAMVLGYIISNFDSGRP